MLGLLDIRCFTSYLGLQVLFYNWNHYTTSIWLSCALTEVFVQSGGSQYVLSGYSNALKWGGGEREIFKEQDILLRKG